MSGLKRAAAGVTAAMALVGGLATGLAGPASAASSCPSYVSTHYIGGGYYGAEWATGSSLVSSTSSGYCTYYGTIHIYATYGSGETTHGGYWSAYSSQV
jgi:hypothetical protein